MTTLRRVLAGAAATTLALTVGMAPAEASNPVIHDFWASAKYIDKTDQLCAKTSKGMDTKDSWSTAEIRLNGVVKFSKTKYGNGTAKWACTKNLSIPEDKKYTLVVHSCTVHSNPHCTSNRTTFYS